MYFETSRPSGLVKGGASCVGRWMDTRRKTAIKFVYVYVVLNIYVCVNIYLKKYNLK